jgi:predicted DNA binding CopG/RHH family protein
MIMPRTKKIKLDDKEQEILTAYESGKMKGSGKTAHLIAAAKATLKKNKNINIRIPENDLDAIKMKAVREGMPYQTLIGSVLHKYAAGYLKEVV